MASTLVGLEITEESVRAVEVKRGRTPVLLAAGEVALPPEAARDSEVLDRDVVAMALRQLWSTFGIKGREVTLGVGSRRILVREYTTQAMAPELLRQALPFQVQDLLPVPANQAVLDFYPLSQKGDQVSGLLVAAVAETIEQLITTTHARSSRRRRSTSCRSASRASQSASYVPGETVAMIHIGDHTTHVVIASDGVPQFVRMIPVDVPPKRCAGAMRRSSRSGGRRRRARPRNRSPDALERHAHPGEPAHGRSRRSSRRRPRRPRPQHGLVFRRPAGRTANHAACVSGAGYLAPRRRRLPGPRRSKSRCAPCSLPTSSSSRAGSTLPDELAFNAVSTLGVLLGEVN